MYIVTICMCALCILYTYVHSSVNVIAEELLGSYIAPFHVRTYVHTYIQKQICLLVSFLLNLAE